MTVDPLQYARRWKTLARALAEPGDHRARQHDPQRRPADAAGRVRRLAFEAAVDGRLLPARVRRPAARLRHARRPLRAQARAPGGRVDLRARQPRRPRRRLRRPGDRRARRDGRRRGADHARHPLDHRQPVHRRRNAARRSRSGPRWRRSGSGSARWPAGCCSSGSTGRPSSWSTCRSRLLALLLGIRYVPESRDPRPGSFDLLGAALSTAGFSILVYAIIEAPEQGWRPAPVLGSLAASVALLGAFLWWERRDSPSRCSTSASSAAPASASARRRSASPSSPCSARSSR